MLREEQFKTYMRNVRGLSEGSIRNYVTGIQTINDILQKNKFRLLTVFAAECFEDLDDIKDFLEHNSEYHTKNTVEHNMYSASFKHFYRFAYVQIASEK